ncbi:MAG: L-seryl-tRNA(Sec) selenium transferase [Betaproteobacteria bacterium]|nr:L-seryl-tRNA(Sec) selenium transferase [Betaproteobacteria bacterium]
MLNAADTARRAIPSVDRLLRLERVAALIARYGKPLVVETVRAALDDHRAALQSRATIPFDEQAFVDACESRLAAQIRPALQPVFNLTGTVLHTNLGRALLPREAAEAVVQAMTRACNLEFDLGGGARGDRDTHVGRWLTRLVGAEAATVVNNNAAAVYLTLNTLAQKKEVVVSRGELIEIGGAFRMPDIMARAGCRLREVGTTNRTHLDDYAQALGPRTAAIMKVHTSNYAVQGFTAAVDETELAALAARHGLPFIVDLGSGMLVDLERYGLPHEPTPREALAHGADVVTFSGDKLLGGPQAGLIVGKAALIRKIKKNPLKRALRVGKMTIAALDAVLRLYADPERLGGRLPTLKWLARPLSDIEAQAGRVMPAVAHALCAKAEVAITRCMSQIGSGSLPVDLLPSAGIAVTGGGRRASSFPEKIAAAFRALPVPVIGRIKESTFILDLRCLDDETGFVAQLDKLRL